MNQETKSNPSVDWTADNLPYLQAYSGTKEEFDILRELAREDNHAVFYPTEVIWKGGQRVGWFSVGAMPTVWAWMSTRRMKIRDSLQAINTVEAVCRRTGSPGVFLPCDEKSPFFPYLEKIGYVDLGKFHFFFKPFNQADIIR
jgi:hypothetical protein